MGANVETLEARLWDKPVRRISCGQTNEPKKQDDSRSANDLTIPDWLFSPASRETAPLRLAPSRLTDEEADDSDYYSATDAAYSPAGNHDKYFRGRTLHRLLELLPEIEPAKQADAADRLLEKLAHDVSPEIRSEWRDEVMTVLKHADFEDVFAPGSHAEVSIIGKLKGAKQTTIISGQIDRLSVTRDRVLIVDYKTNRPPPGKIENAAPAYIAQMTAYRAVLQEIYPEHQIDAALLWTWEARIMPIPPAMLDDALEKAKLRA